MKDCEWHTDMPADDDGMCDICHEEWWAEIEHDIWHDAL